MIPALPASDLIEILRWLATLGLGSFLARPLVGQILPQTGGWIAAKLLAWIFVGWLPWLMAQFQLLPFRPAAASGLLALALIWGIWRHKGGAGQGNWRNMLLAEGLFLLLFLLGLATRLQEPDLLGLEKFTDMGFVAAAMRSEYMPPQDAWYAAIVSIIITLAMRWWRLGAIYWASQPPIAISLPWQAFLP